MQQVVEWNPGDAKALNDLGNLFDELDRPEDAERTYRRSLQSEPENAQARSNLGILLKNLERVDEAIAIYRTVIASNKDDVPVYLELGNLLKSDNRLEEAAGVYRNAISADPSRVDVYRSLCGVLSRLGELEEAARVCQAWLDRDADNPVARHMLSAFAGQNAEPRASDAYITAVFDEFAATFEEHLDGLRYRGPERIREALEAWVDSPPSPTLDVLDAGCGTGLCGPILRPYAKRLAGVDLSLEMLPHARERAVYDSLVQGELTEFLAAHPSAYDLVVAADTFIYFGQLDTVFGAVSAALRSGGRLLFTLEGRANSDRARCGYRLEGHGRYTHAREYVRHCLAECGLRTLCLESFDVREQAGMAVPGLFILAVDVST